MVLLAGTYKMNWMYQAITWSLSDPKLFVKQYMSVECVKNQSKQFPQFRFQKVSKYKLTLLLFQAGLEFEIYDQEIDGIVQLLEEPPDKTAPLGKMFQFQNRNDPAVHGKCINFLQLNLLARYFP